MSAIKLPHASGNSVSIAAPQSNPAADRTLYLPSNADGTFLTTTTSGSVLQTITTVKTDTSSWAFDTSSNSWKETGLQAVITPTAASNKILIWVSGMYGGSVNGENIYWAFSRSSDSSNFQIGDTSGSRTRVTTGSFLDSTSRPAQFSCFAVDSNHNTTSANTYKLLATGNNQSGTMYLNRTSSDDDGWYRPRGTSTMILQEVAV